MQISKYLLRISVQGIYPDNKVLQRYLLPDIFAANFKTNPMKKTFALMMAVLLTASFSFGQSKQILSHSESPAQAVNYVTDAPGLLYSQMNNGGGTAVASQIFPDFSNCRIQSADDFTVPAGGWKIERVEVIGVYLIYPTLPASSFDVFFYADNAGVPGSEVFHGTGLPFGQAGDIYGVDLTTPADLPAGTYWVCVTPNMAFATGGQWYWQSHATPQIGNQFHFQDPCNLTGMGFTSWTPASVAFNGYDIFDLCFALYGSQAQVPVSDWALVIGIGLIVAFTVIRYRRSA